MTTIYKIDYPNADKPIRQEVDKFGYPHPDADGETQYSNTHFADEGEAWKTLLKELQAGLSLRAGMVKRMIEELQKAKDVLVNDAILLENAKQGYSKFLSKNPEIKIKD